MTLRTSSNHFVRLSTLLRPASVGLFFLCATTSGRALVLRTEPLCVSAFGFDPSRLQFHSHT